MIRALQAAVVSGTLCLSGSPAPPVSAAPARLPPDAPWSQTLRTAERADLPGGLPSSSMLRKAARARDTGWSLQQLARLLYANREGATQFSSISAKMRRPFSGSWHLLAACSKLLNVTTLGFSPASFMASKICQARWGWRLCPHARISEV